MGQRRGRGRGRGRYHGSGSIGEKQKGALSGKQGRGKAAKGDGASTVCPMRQGAARGAVSEIELEKGSGGWLGGAQPWLPGRLAGF